MDKEERKRVKSSATCAAGLETTPPELVELICFLELADVQAWRLVAARSVLCR